MFVGNIFDGAASGIDTGDIGHSLRWRRSASANIATGVTTATTSTYFAFFKQGALDAINPIFDGNIKINANNTITAFGLTTSAVKRDPTSFHWIHVSNNGLVFDGVNLGAVTTSAITNLRLGYDGTNYADMYGARICCVSGTSLAYTDFVYFNTEINEWVVKSQSAIKALVEAGGSASFMYEFDNATSLTTLGYDKSSKGNNATLNNFSLTAGTTYDHMLDVPGNSYCTINNIAGSTTGTASDGNLKLTTGTTHCRWFGTMAMSAGSWVWEGTCTTAIGNDIIGIVRTDQSPNGGDLGDSAYGYGYAQTGQKKNNGSVSAYGASYTSGDVIRMEYNATSGSLTFFKNGTSQGVAFSGLTGEYYPAFGDTVNASGGTVWNLNFGQAPLHASATYHSAAGGYFRDAPTTGFKALCQRNLTDVATSLLDPTDHHIDITVTKSGDTNFTLPWNADTYDTFFEIKRRDAAGDWYQIDGLRGYTKILKSNSTAAETTDANVLGISGTTGTLKSTLANGTYIVSATKAGLSASRQTNTDGSITSTVSRNVDSGFAIVTYTGTGANATWGHGLGVAPKMVVVYERAAGGDDHIVYHIGLTSASYAIRLNTTAAQTGPSAAYWNSTAPSSTIVSVGTSGESNQSAATYVAYCYADSAIQKSFSYTGNGSADGPYVNLGFKCGRLLFKRSDSGAYDWGVEDSVRDSYNVSNHYVAPNTASVEATNAGTDLDFNSNSYKLRSAAWAGFNGSGGTIIGHAWAATTGKYSLAR